jgi:hypothetical protein
MMMATYLVIVEVGVEEMLNLVLLTWAAASLTGHQLKTATVLVGSLMAVDLSPKTAMAEATTVVSLETQELNLGQVQGGIVLRLGDY